MDRRLLSRGVEPENAPVYLFIHGPRRGRGHAVERTGHAVCSELEWDGAQAQRQVPRLVRMRA